MFTKKIRAKAGLVNGRATGIEIPFFVSSSKLAVDEGRKAE